MNPLHFFAELKRRNVIRVAGLYLVGAWLLTQVASTVLPVFDVPAWALRGLIITLALGFIPALIFSWIFELTPQGLKRDEDVRPEESIAPQTARRMNRMIIAVLLLALGYFGFDKFVLTPRREVALVAATEKSMTARPAPDAKPAVDPKSVAVLPFKNYSGDANQEYFADGMTDLLTTELGGIGALTVRSHQSSLKFKGSTKSMPEIGQELHADVVIEGSMLREGNHITVNVQLIEAPTDRHLWAKKFEGEVTNIFKVRNEVVEAIAREIKTTISPEQSSRLSSARAVDSAALQEYLLGRQSWNRQSEKGFAEALEHFNRAKEIDPGFALAWAGVAEYYWGAAPDIASPEEVAKGKAAARRAVELDDSLAEAHTALAMLNYAVDYEWGESEREFQRAIRLNSNYAAARWQYGWLLVYLGRFEEALKEMQQAEELDPLSTAIATDLSGPYTLKKDYDKAIAQCRKALELDPSFFVAHFVLGWIEMKRGANYAKAIEEFHLVQTIETQPMATGLLGYAYARIGQKDKARETLNELNRLASRRFVSPYHQALVYLGLGENSQAIDWLEKAYDKRSPWLTWLKVEPMFDPLRSDPRFQALYKKMNFPP